MFGLSLLFLVFIAALVVVWIDIPRVDLTGSLTGRRGSESLPWELAGIRLGSYIAMGLFILWPLFIAEFLFNFLRRANRGKTFWQRNRSGLLVCFLPPLRLAAPCHAMNGRIWLPGLGWRMPGKRLSKTLESKFSKPMLFIAMLILPVLIVEFGLQDYVEQDFSARLALHLCTGFIWTAFSFEFIICEKPRMEPHIEEMRKSLGLILDIAISAISIKSKTHEKLDGIGKGLGIAVHALCNIKLLT